MWATVRCVNVSFVMSVTCDCRVCDLRVFDCKMCDCNMRLCDV